MDGTLRNTIIGSIVIMTLSIAYYLVVFIPNRQELANKQKHLDNQLKCQKATESYIKSDEKNYPYGNYLVLDPEYIYNDELNTCLYKKQTEFSWSDGIPAYNDNYIIDVYANKIIAHSYQHYDLAGNVNDSRGVEEYKKINELYFEGK